MPEKDKKGFPVKVINQYLILFTMMGVIFSAGTTFFWKTFAAPRIKNQIIEEQKPILARMEEIEKRLVYQNILKKMNMDKEEIALADLQFDRWEMQSRQKKFKSRNGTK